MRWGGVRGRIRAQKGEPRLAVRPERQKSVPEQSRPTNRTTAGEDKKADKQRQ